jgi:hypothetical protein
MQDDYVCREGDFAGGPNEATDHRRSTGHIIDSPAHPRPAQPTVAEDRFNSALGVWESERWCKHGDAADFCRLCKAEENERIRAFLSLA